MSLCGDSAEPDVVVLEQRDTAAAYWSVEFQLLGMVSAQADRLADTPGVDRHAVRETLRNGCPPDTCFLIYSD